MDIDLEIRNSKALSEISALLCLCLLLVALLSNEVILIYGVGICYLSAMVNSRKYHSLTSKKKKSFGNDAEEYF